MWFFRDFGAMLMQNSDVGGRIFVKYYFMIFLATALIFINISSALAGGTPPPNLNGNQFVQQIQNGTLNNQQAQAFLQNNANLSQADAAQLTGIINNAGNLDPQALGTMVDGFLGPNSPLSGADLGNIGSMVQQFANGSASPQAILSTFTDMAQGRITSAIGQALSNVPGLGNIQNLANLGNLLNQAGVLNALNGALGQLGAQGVATALGNIVGLAANPGQLTAQAQQQAAQLLTQQIQTLAPGLYNAINSVLGPGAVGAIVSAFLGSGSGAPFSTAPTTSICGVQCSAANRCGQCAPDIQANHYRIRDYIRESFVTHRNWFMNNFWVEYIQPALGLMTNELVGTSMQQVYIIGTFFDAKHQLETQRLFQQLTAQAHKDYHPSESLCVVGTNTRYFANAKRRADSAQIVTAERMMQRQLNNSNSSAYVGEISDIRTRIDDFIGKYCDPAGGGVGNQNTGLSLLCQNTPAGNAHLRNADVNYTTTIENKLTLRNAFINGAEGFASEDEQKVFALGSNLFAHQTMPTIDRSQISFPDGTPKDVANLYYDLRSMAAKRSVAQNSFAAITAMRAEGEGESGPFLKAILTSAGVSNTEAEDLLDINPSLFAQEEVMMKLVYQNPTFYSNLYDKPANIERISTAMLALELIQDRNIYDSLIRSEAVLATLVETMLLKDHRRVSGELGALNVNKRLRGQ